MNWKWKCVISIVFSLLSFVLPYYQSLTIGHYGGEYYSYITTNSYFFGNHITILDTWQNETYVIWSFILSDFWESPYSELGFFHFIAFVLAFSGLVLATLSLCIRTKRNLCDFSFRLTLDSIILMWMPVLLFDTFKRSEQYHLASVVPSFGFFFSCIAIVPLFMSTRSYTPLSRSLIPTHQLLMKLSSAKVTRPSKRLKKLVQSKTVICVLVLLLGISSVNYGMSVWSVHRLEVVGIPYYKMQYKTHDQHPDVHIWIRKDELVIDFIGSILNPSLTFVKAHYLKMRMYLNNTFFGQFRHPIEQVLEPGGDFDLDFRILLNMNNMSNSQLQLLEFTDDYSRLIYEVEGTVKASSFAYQADIKFSHRSIATCSREE